MGHYLHQLSEGANYAEAADGTGFGPSAFYKLRRRDAGFASACEDAIDRSSGMRFIQGGARRRLQLRRSRRTRFTDSRKEIFLSWFASTGNLTEAAAKAGVSVSTVDYHRRKDPAFERAVQQALDHCYLKLDAELVAGRLAAQRRLLAVEPAAEPGPEFDRALKLLQRWDRLRGRAGAPAPAAALGRWEFEEAVILLEKKLRNMGIPIEPLPPGYERPDDPLSLPPPVRDREGGGGGEGEGEEGA